MFKQSLALATALIIPALSNAAPVCFSGFDTSEKICLERTQNVVGSPIRVSVIENDESLVVGVFVRQGSSIVRVKNGVNKEEHRLLDTASIKVSNPWPRAKKIELFSEDMKELATFSKNAQDAIDPEVGTIGDITVDNSKQVYSTPISIPDVRMVTEMVIDPSNPRRIYIVALQKSVMLYGLFRTDDAGTSWQKLEDLSNDYTSYGHTMKVSGDGSKVILIASNGMGKDVTLLYSNDSGASFSSLIHKPVATRTKSSPRSTAIHLTKDGKDFFIGDSSRFISHYNWDGSAPELQGKMGSPITQIRQGSEQDVSIVTIENEPGNNMSLYVGTGNLLYRQESDGTWTELGRGVYDDSTIYNIEFMPNKGLRISSCNSVYETSAGYNYLSRATPAFHKLRSNAYRLKKNESFISTPGYVRAFWVEANPFNSNEVLIAAHSGLYQSQDAGNTWKRLLLVNGERNDHPIEYRKIVWLDKNTVMTYHTAVKVDESRVMSIIHLR